MTRSRKRKLRRTQAVAMAGFPIASTMLGMSPAAMAQQAGIPEIIVTATKRAENLQSVPIAIDVLGTEKLTQLNVSRFDDYALLLPSVSFTTTGPGFERVYMRGVASGENGNHSGPLPSVGVYLDEQPITTIQGALDIHAYDLARVESLAGPQGTLYGASSQAGTIRIITNKPSMDGFEAAYDLSGNTVRGGDFGYEAEGFVNIPITSNAAVRLVGWYTHDGGFISNVAASRVYPTTGTCISNASVTPVGCLPTPQRERKNFNAVDTYGGRAALRIDLNDRWTITPQLMGQEQKYHGTFFYEPSVGDLKINRFYPDYTEDHWLQASLTVEGKIGNFDLTYNSSYLERHDRTESDYSEYSFEYDVQYGAGASWTDPTGTPIPDISQYIIGTDDYKKLSHEVRIASPKDWRLRFVAGLFFESQEHKIFQDYKINGLGSRETDPNTSLSVKGWPDTIWLTDQIRVDRDYAAFGEVTYDFIPDKLSLMLGARVFHTENSLRGFFGFGINYYNPATPPIKYGEALCNFSGTQASYRQSPCTNVDADILNTDYVPKGTLTWKIDQDRLLYFTYSKGFRPGGINRVDATTYDPDFLTNYEIGWKSSWLDNTVRFNGAVFRQDWTDIQYSFLPPNGNGLTVIRNAGDALIQGIDGDLQWATPLEGLSVSAGFELLNARLSKDYVAPASTAVAGTRLPTSPDFKWNMIARYQFNLAGFDAHVQASMVNATRIYSDLLPSDRVTTGTQSAYALFDFAVGADKGPYSAEFFVKNAFDERAILDKSIPCAICTAEVQATPSVPRLAGIRFSQKFGGKN